MPILGDIPVVGVMLIIAGLGWALININSLPMVVDLTDAVQIGTFTGGNVIGTLANEGVALAPFHQLDHLVSDELKAELEQLKADIIAGVIVLD